jgi:hypothetical protein
MMVAAISSCSASQMPVLVGCPDGRRAGAAAMPHPPGPPPMTDDGRSIGRPKQPMMTTVTMPMAALVMTGAFR